MLEMMEAMDLALVTFEKFMMAERHVPSLLSKRLPEPKEDVCLPAAAPTL